MMILPLVLSSSSLPSSTGVQPKCLPQPCRLASTSEQDPHYTRGKLARTNSNGSIQYPCGCFAWLGRRQDPSDGDGRHLHALGGRHSELWARWAHRALCGTCTSPTTGPVMGPTLTPRHWCGCGIQSASSARPRKKEGRNKKEPGAKSSFQSRSLTSRAKILMRSVSFKKFDTK